MKLPLVTLATLVAAAIALPAPKDTYSIMKRQIGSGNNEGEGTPWKRADGANGHGSLVKKQNSGEVQDSLINININPADIDAAIAVKEPADAFPPIRGGSKA